MRLFNWIRGLFKRPAPRRLSVTDIDAITRAMAALGRESIIHYSRDFDTAQTKIGDTWHLRRPTCFVARDTERKEEQ
jgi:hypothetical protein